MKKVLFIVLITFILIPCINGAEKFYLGEKVPNMYIESKTASDIHNGAPFLLTRSDGKLVYCLNPFKMMDTNNYYKSYTYNDPIFNLSDDIINKMNIISYYGYGYGNHTDLKWYGITQFLIYKTLGIEHVYFTDVYYGNRVEKYTKEVKEIEELVNNYYKLPSFAGELYEYNPNSEYEIKDINNVLNNYEIIYSNIEVSVNNNNLIINTGKSGSYVVRFVRKSPITTNYVLYNLEGAQSLLYPGKINDIVFDLNITVNSGSITINKHDYKNVDRLEANIGGATFGVYKDSKLVQKLVLDSNGIGSVGDLPLGNYVVKELIPSKGYKLDTNTYNITLSKDKNNITLHVYSKVIKGNLIINKYYGSNDDYKLDLNAVFEIYNNDKLIKTVSGQVVENLEYGNYYIKQINGKKYYDLIKDFSVSISEEKDYVYDFYTDKTDEIKAYEELLNKKEEGLNKKEEELNDLQKKLEKEKEVLNDLKQEIIEKQSQIDEEKQNLDKIKDEINKKEEEIKKLEDSIQEELKNVNKDNDFIQEEKKKLNKQEKELTKLQKDLIDKEKKLLELEENIKKKNIELNKKEVEIERLKEKYNNNKNILVVEVPNTYKNNNLKIISKMLLLVGICIIIVNFVYSKRKKVC